jgi:hypothetical protein
MTKDGVILALLAVIALLALGQRRDPQPMIDAPTAQENAT